MSNYVITNKWINLLNSSAVCDEAVFRSVIQEHGYVVNSCKVMLYGHSMFVYLRTINSVDVIYRRLCIEPLKIISVSGGIDGLDVVAVWYMFRTIQNQDE